jgi:hypothetical protein
MSFEYHIQRALLHVKGRCPCKIVYRSILQTHVQYKGYTYTQATSPLWYIYNSQSQQRDTAVPHHTAQK